MNLFIDSNVFVAALQAEPKKGEIAKRILDSDHQLATSIAVIMEVRTVLLKKKGCKSQRVSFALNRIKSELHWFIKRLPDMSLINQNQKETLLYPMDCIHYSTATENDMEIVSFDSELQDNGAMAPSDLI